VPLPTALPQEHMDRVAEFAWQGGNVLLLCDSFPYADLEKAPMRPPGAGRNPFQQPRGPEPQRGDLTPLLSAMGVSFPKDRAVWDAYNPHPKFEFEREIVILAAQSGDRPSNFNEEDPITAGLQELLLLYPGELEVNETPELKATTLLKTGAQSGWHRWDEMVQESFFGIQPLPPHSRPYQPKDAPRTLAVRVKGKMRAPADVGLMKRGELGQEFEAIVISDIDMISDVFYNLRQERRGDLPELDNVAFIGNCIDALAGEDAYLQLRKLRPKHRTLARLEASQAELNRRKAEAVKAAKEQSKKQLDEAQKRFESAGDELEKDTTLDRRTKAVMLRAAQEREQRRLDAEKRRIEDAERDAIRKSERDNKRLRRELVGKIQAVARFAPPIPVLLLGMFVFWRKVKREREGTPARRRRVA
jgi:ABC-2 type transport system permease protein